MNDPVDEELGPLLDLEARLAEMTPVSGMARWLTFALFVVLEEGERREFARRELAAEERAPSSEPLRRLVDRLREALPPDDEIERRLREVLAHPDAAASPPTEEDIEGQLRWLREGPEPSPP